MSNVSKPMQVDIATRHIRRWMKPAAWMNNPNFDHPAYDRIADTLIRAITDVGPAHTDTTVAALTKTTAILAHQMLLGADEEAVREFGDAVGKMIALEVLALRVELVRPVSRRKDRA